MAGVFETTNESPVGKEHPEALDSLKRLAVLPRRKEGRLRRGCGCSASLACIRSSTFVGLSLIIITSFQIISRQIVSADA